LFLSPLLAFFLFSSEDDDEVPLSKRAKILNEKAELSQQSNPSTVEPILPPRTSVAKVPRSMVNPSASALGPPDSRDHVSNIWSNILLVPEPMLDSSKNIKYRLKSISYVARYNLFQFSCCSHFLPQLTLWQILLNILRA
jgi:hypothetical protein